MVGARTTDPRTSQIAVARITRDMTIYERIVRRAAFAFDAGKPWTDTWMAREVDGQRNVVARVRLEVERDGWITRVGETPGPNPQLLFRMLPAYRAVLDMTDTIQMEG